jgi:hypothetical protein
MIPNLFIFYFFTTRRVRSENFSLYAKTLFIDPKPQSKIQNIARNAIAIARALASEIEYLEVYARATLVSDGSSRW